MPRGSYLSDEEKLELQRRILELRDQGLSWEKCAKELKLKGGSKRTWDIAHWSPSQTAPRVVKPRKQLTKAKREYASQPRSFGYRPTIRVGMPYHELMRPEVAEAFMALPKAKKVKR